MNMATKVKTRRLNLNGTVYVNRNGPQARYKRRWWTPVMRGLWYASMLALAFYLSLFAIYQLAYGHDENHRPTNKGAPEGAAPRSAAVKSIRVDRPASPGVETESFPACAPHMPCPTPADYIKGGESFNAYFCRTRPHWCSAEYLRWQRHAIANSPTTQELVEALRREKARQNSAPVVGQPFQVIRPNEPMLQCYDIGGGIIHCL